AVAADTPLGRMAKAAMDAGQLVSDEIVLGMIRERLAEPDAQRGFILDGFPRNLSQAETLDGMLRDLGQPLDLALLIDVDFDVLMQRLTGRRTCESCGAVYNVYSSPPKFDDRCDLCGGNLRRRADDNEETIGNRLRVYEAQTTPVIEYYRRQRWLRTVQGVGEISDVFQAICRILDPLSRGEAVPGVEPATGDAKPAVAKRVRSRAPAKRAGGVAPAAGAAAKKKSAAKKTAKKKVIPKKKAVAKKPAAKKKAAKKKAVKKTVMPKKKAAAKKVAAKKVATKKKTALGKVTVRRKVVAKKTVRRGGTRKKADAKGRPTAKKGVRRRVPRRPK
ncbi:MAG TPA: nucleoside monophosphate kinase, partial [Chromatiales bacterium]|nr:nucleoside monophosphate kinase [Chromatiales bacterium]